MLVVTAAILKINDTVIVNDEKYSIISAPTRVKKTVTFYAKNEAGLEKIFQMPHDAAITLY